MRPREDEEHGKTAVMMGGGMDEACCDGLRILCFDTRNNPKVCKRQRERNTVMIEAVLFNQLRVPVVRNCDTKQTQK